MMQLRSRLDGVRFWGCALVLACAPVLTAQQAASGWQEDFQAGTEALAASRFADAENSFREAIRLNPRFAGAYFNLGLALSSERKHPEALEAFVHARKLNPLQRGIHLFLGIEEYNVSDLDAAITELKAATKQTPKDAKAWMWFGVSLMVTGKTAEAVTALDQAAALDSDDVDIMYHRGKAHMQLSQEIYQTMLDKHPNSWRIHEVLAQSLDLQENINDAILEYKRAIEAAPEVPGLHESVGDLLWEQNQLDAAKEAYEAEERIDPSNANVLFKLGALAVLQLRPTDAMPLLETALKKDPQLYSARFWKARAEESLGKLPDAANDYEASAAASKSDTETEMVTQYHLSQVYRKLHEPEKASAALKSFQALRATQTDANNRRIAQKRRVQLGMKQESGEMESAPQ